MIPEIADPAGPRHAVPADVIDAESFATLEFELLYASGGARHRERRLAPQVNLWRDILPDGLDAALIGKRAGDRVTRRYDLLGPSMRRDPALVREIRFKDFDGHVYPQWPLQPDLGRFLPQGTLHRAGIGGIFRENRKPFRVTSIGPESFVADRNHPLAGAPVEVVVSVVSVSRKSGDRGGRCVDWTEVLADGPGMQLRAGGQPTAFFERDWAARPAEGSDAEFYAKPRFVAHIDRRAIEAVTALYGEILCDGMRILDLMSADRSHLPTTLRAAHVAGLGMNAEELDRNRVLSDRLVHDLNAHPRLPYADATFDAAISTVSFEYLTRPVDVVGDVARVLRPGAPFAVTFSDRWFPPKVVKVWSTAHPYERLGYVLECFLRTGAFEGLETLAVRGYPRPEDDPHFGETAEGDPVFAVWGRRRI